MRLALLTFAATVLPFFWGWAVHWLMSQLWPERQPDNASDPSVKPNVPTDFQI
jgi:hypothetical protein